MEFQNMQLLIRASVMFLVFITPAISIAQDAGKKMMLGQPCNGKKLLRLPSQGLNPPPLLPMVNCTCSGASPNHSMLQIKLMSMMLLPIRGLVKKICLPGSLI